MTQDQALFLLNEVYLPQIRDEHKTTRRLIEAIPADQCNYAPHATSMTAMKLASHIAGSECFFMHGAANGEFNRAAAAIPESVTTPAQLLAWYDENFAKAVAKLSKGTGDDLVRMVPFAIFNLPAIAYVGLMINHSVHHRGQLSAYLRPMGAKVPRIYGGSADDPIVIPQQATAN
jgi:uncharacterized damage-inducible protein DinB